MQWPFYLRPGFVKLGTDTDNKTPKVSSHSRKKNGSSSLGPTIAFRNGGTASASPKAMATIVGQAHHAKMRILVVDEHPLLRDGVINLINRQIDMVACGSADNIPSVGTALTGCKPDLILLGLRLGT